MRKTKLLVNWTYRLLTLLIVGLATFSGEFLITRANNTPNNSIPAGCILVDDNTKTTQLRLSGSHLNQNVKDALDNDFKADPNGKLSIGLDCSPSSNSDNNSVSTNKPNPGPKVYHTLSITDLNSYCQSKGYLNASQYSNASTGRALPDSFMCVSSSGSSVPINPQNGSLTYLEACQQHVSKVNIQVRFNHGHWDCLA